jgi:hypothetical protein
VNSTSAGDDCVPGRRRILLAFSRRNGTVVIRSSSLWLLLLAISGWHGRSAESTTADVDDALNSGGKPLN